MPVSRTMKVLVRNVCGEMYGEERTRTQQIKALRRALGAGEGLRHKQTTSPVQPEEQHRHQHPPELCSSPNYLVVINHSTLMATGNTASGNKFRKAQCKITAACGRNYVYPVAAIASATNVWLHATTNGMGGSRHASLQAAKACRHAWGAVGTGKWMGEGKVCSPQNTKAQRRRRKNATRSRHACRPVNAAFHKPCPWQCTTEGTVIMTVPKLVSLEKFPPNVNLLHRTVYKGPGIMGTGSTAVSWERDKIRCVMGIRAVTEAM